MPSRNDKLAIFDIDGTIAVRGVIPESVVKGIIHIQSLGYLTTVSTGRSYLRAKEALGENFERLISPEVLISIEHGTKIVTKKGVVISADYFQPNELDHVVDFSEANKDMIRLMWFTSPDPTQKVQIWCKRPEDIEVETIKRGSYAELFHGSFSELRQRLAEYPVSNVSAKLEEYITAHNLKLHFTRSEIDILFQDTMMEFLRNISDKAKAVTYLEKHHGIAIKDMLVAGNAINDVDMLNLPAGKRILVGSGPNTETIMQRLTEPNEVIRIDSPEALGLFLKSL